MYAYLFILLNSFFMKNFIYSNIAASILVISSPVYAQPKTPTTEPQKSETVIKNSKDICVAMINGQATLT